MSLSIRWKLILTVGLPLLVSYAVILTMDHRILRDNATTQAQYAVAQEAAAHADRFNTRFQAVQATAWATARLIGSQPEDDEQLSPQDRWLSAQQRLERILGGAVLLDPVIRSAAVYLNLPEGNKSLSAWGNQPGTGGRANQPGLNQPYYRQYQAQALGNQSRLGLQVTPSGQAGSTQNLLNLYPDRLPPWLKGAGRNLAAFSGRFPDAGWSEPYFDPDLKTWAMAYVCPIRSTDLTPSQLQDADLAPPTNAFSPTGPRMGVLALILPLVNDANGSATPAGLFANFGPVPAQANVTDNAANPATTGQNQPKDTRPTNDTRAANDTTIRRSAKGEGGPWQMQHAHALVSAGNRLLAHPNVDGIGKTLPSHDPPTDFDRAVLAAQKEGQASIVRVTSQNDINPQAKGSNTAQDDADPMWWAVEPVGTIGGAMVMAMPEAEVMDSVNEGTTRRAVAGGLQILVLWVLLYVLAVRLVRPIEKLNTAVHALSQGDLKAQAKVQSGDEIGQLAQGFDQMVEQLSEHVDQLTTETAAREKVESELRIARQIQLSLLPKTFVQPEDRAFDAHALNRPAREIAGDFYDHFQDAQGRWLFVIADVSGKGVPAALLMAVTRTLLRQFLSAGMEPAQAVAETGAKLHEDNPGNMFVTLFLLRYDPATGQMVYVNAGHPKPCLLDPNGRAQWFGDITASIQGIATEAELGPVEQQTACLEPGHTLLLFTDGVTEARNPRNDRMLTDRGLTDLLNGYGPMSPQTLCERLARDLSAFQANHLIDDLTLLALQHAPGSGRQV